MDFYKRVALVCGRIPRGRAATYGQIALLCGRPRNSRQVGYALNHRIPGEEVPAHRVVNHQGFLTGAAAFEMPGLQRLLLEEEGVEVSAGRVDLKRFGWKNTMEDAEELLQLFHSEGI